MHPIQAPRPKILIVDDRPENLYALQKTLAPLGVDVLQAKSGNDALGLALDYEFCVAILDVQMPKMDGYELAELLRGNQGTATLPIIFVSAVYSDEYHHRKGYDAGAVDFISKPFIPEILLSKIKVFIDLYQQRQQLQNLVGELNRANQQLELVNKELQTLSYSVSHDLRAPLRAIDSYSRMLADALAQTEISSDVGHFMHTLRDNVIEMNALLEGLLKFSQLAFQPLAIREIEMKAIAQKVLDELMATESGRRIEIKLGELPNAFADPIMLAQVFNHLISNALKFSQKQKAAQVEVSFLIKDGQSIYFVRDNGVGFDMRFAEKLFSIFQRFHPSTEFAGTGIGLACARRIILRHGGEIWAESQPNEGATFFFTLSQG
jgi:two-component system, sensor histidine kinase and response regulator